MLNELNVDYYIFDDVYKQLAVVYVNEDGNDGDGELVIDNYDYDFLQNYCHKHYDETLYDSVVSFSKQLNDSVDSLEYWVGSNYLIITSNLTLKNICYLINNH